jgi:hypothetical protein
MKTHTQTARHNPAIGRCRLEHGVCVSIIHHAPGILALRENNRPSPQGTF